MGIGISTLSNFLLTKASRKALVGVRLTFNASVRVPHARRTARSLASAMGPAWSGYAYDVPGSHTVIVLEQETLDAS